uniref:Uncharacterized protein n=1 Tax=Mimivirus LCMiAC01 TaxID=2506608 RepID=A0A481YZY0_9VIRU|nr:MAG: hypothetical protein LCMiAC01_00590 [Mimivirus LCMiAC01]
MNIINIVLLLIIVYVIYALTVDTKTVNKKSNKMIPRMYSTRSYKDDLINDIVSVDDSYRGQDVIKKELLNPNFINNQWHNDYRDVLTAINNIVPDKIQLFNLANIPIKYSEPGPAEVKYMITDFLGVLNYNLDTEVPSRRNCNSGWDEAIPDPRAGSGWANMRKSLGLPVSLYDKPTEKSNVKLIAINMVQKYETEDEIRYSCDIVIQKLNVDDQMILKIVLVQDKRPLNDENMFFNDEPNINLRVHVENIFINGFLSHEGNDAKLQFDGDRTQFFDYDKLEQNNMTDPKYIRDILMRKYKQKTQEMEQRNALLDEEGQEFHRTLPHIYDFSNIIGTKSLFEKKPY